MMVGGFSMRIGGMRRTNRLVERDLHPKVVSLAKRQILMDVVGAILTISLESSSRNNYFTLVLKIERLAVWSSGTRFVNDIERCFRSTPEAPEASRGYDLPHASFSRLCA